MIQPYVMHIFSFFSSKSLDVGCCSQERIISPSVPRRMDRLTSAPPGEIQNARYQPAPQVCIPSDL